MTFEPLTVAVDEMPSIVDAVGRDIAQVWRQWLREGRKVGLYLVLATQSTRVRTLGIAGEADLLRNFSFALVLGNVARSEYPGVVNGMTRPAALVTAGRARPVVIPRILSDADACAVSDARVAPAADLDGDGDGDAILLPGDVRRPLFIAATPPHEPDPEHLTADDRARIIRAWHDTGVLAEVQRRIFPSYTSSGGRAFYAIKDTLAEAGELSPYNGYNPTPGY